MSSLIEQVFPGQTVRGTISFKKADTHPNSGPEVHDSLGSKAPASAMTRISRTLAQMRCKGNRRRERSVWGDIILFPPSNFPVRKDDRPNARQRRGVLFGIFDRALAQIQMLQACQQSEIAKVQRRLLLFDR